MINLNITGLKKSGLWTDIHYGKKNNSETHNQDCLRFTEFFCNKIKEDKEIDHLIFLGDWYDHRNAINIATYNYSYDSMKMVEDLGLPVFWVVGNHDLYTKNNREIHSLPHIGQFKQFYLIEEPTRINKDILCLPYIFEEEYKTYLKEINESKVIYGHLELKGFVLTGTSVVMEHGPDHTLFFGPKRIFTGHFHKRQTKDNVTYIGNTFPFDFSDANDTDRGFATYEYKTDKLTFTNWTEAPSYIRCNLSKLLKNHKTILKKDATVRALIDVELDVEQASDLRIMLVDKYKLRELSFEEEVDSIDMGEDIDLEGLELETTNAIIRELLNRVDSKKLSKEKLIKIYEGLR